MCDVVYIVYVYATALFLFCYDTVLEIYRQAKEVEGDTCYKETEL